MTEFIKVLKDIEEGTVQPTPVSTTGEIVEADRIIRCVCARVCLSVCPSNQHLSPLLGRLGVCVHVSVCLCVRPTNTCLHFWGD